MVRAHAWRAGDPLRLQQGKPRIDLKLGGADIFIMPVAPGDDVNPPPVTPYQGLDHFGLTVSGIDAVAADLKAKGVEFTMEPRTIRARHAHLLPARSARYLDRAAGSRSEIRVSVMPGAAVPGFKCLDFDAISRPPVDSAASQTRPILRCACILCVYVIRRISILPDTAV